MRIQKAGPARRRRRAMTALLAAVTASATAGLGAVALAATYTVQVAKSSVTNQSHSTKTEKIVVSSTGFALYVLTGDSKTHPECTQTNGCFQFWPPATVAAGTHVTKGPGVPGQLGTWKRDGFIQLTLSGHPLYRYTPDIRSHSASGQGVKSFGGTWFVIPAKTSSTGSAGGGGW